MIAEAQTLYDLIKESFLLLDFGDRLYTEVAAAHAGSIARRLASLPPEDVTRTIDSLWQLNRSLSAALDD